MRAQKVHRHVVDLATSRSTGLTRPVLSRLVAYGLPLLIVVVAAFNLNVWPATGWRLFSGVRQETQVTWIIEATDDSGVVGRYDPASQGPHRFAWRHVLTDSVGDGARQALLCEEWLAEARASTPSTQDLTVRRAVVAIPRDDASHTRVQWERVVVSCSS